MADRRETLPLIDVASVVVAPVLVMLMLGSLVFFLIEVLQQGQFTGRLDYTFFFYVFASVLVARISITQGRGKAALYGLVLAAAAFVAMMAFVEYKPGLFQILGPVINVGLLALVWWAASKLTWDCTHLDESRKSSGRGVLAAAGFDRTPSTTTAEDDAEFDPDRSVQETRKKRKKKEPPPPAVVGWWAKFQKFREWRKSKPHTPGVWVLYFALAALPLFALGQAMIPADDTDRRSATFWQMAVYVGSALALLVTTTLMGLRRYLADRRASIPTALTGAWLGLGLLLILLFVGVAAVLPRPHSETPLFTLQKGGKQNRKASDHAQVRDNAAGEGKGAAGQKKEAGDGKTNAKGGKPGGKGEGEGKGQGDKQGGNQSGGNQSGGKQGDKQGGEKGNGDQGNKGKEQKDGGKDGQNGKDADGGNDGDDEGNADGEADGEADGNQSDAFKELGKVGETAGEVIKWIVWIAIAVAVLGGGGYFLLKYLGNFTGWAKGLLDWFRGLFGQKPKPKAKAAEEAEAVAEKELLRPPPFGQFSNPFTDGTARRRSARELAEYTFAAFDAWGWDHATGRQPDETPTEYAVRIAEDHPELEDGGRAAADLYTRVLFSPGELPADAKAKLAAFWEALEAVPV